jgi:hypothetical protein
MNQEHFDMKRMTRFARAELRFELRFLEELLLPSDPRKLMTAHLCWPADRYGITTHEYHGANARREKELSTITGIHSERDATCQHPLG